VLNVMLSIHFPEMDGKESRPGSPTVMKKTRQGSSVPRSLTILTLACVEQPDAAEIVTALRLLNPGMTLTATWKGPQEL
jgi:hypothetical protein